MDAEIVRVMLFLFGLAAAAIAGAVACPILMRHMWKCSYCGSRIGMKPYAQFNEAGNRLRLRKYASPLEVYDLRRCSMEAPSPVYFFPESAKLCHGCLAKMVKHWGTKLTPSEIENDEGFPLRERAELLLSMRIASEATQQACAETMRGDSFHSLIKISGTRTSEMRALGDSEEPEKVIYEIASHGVESSGIIIRTGPETWAIGDSHIDWMD